MSIASNVKAGAAYVEVTADTSKLQRNLSAAQAELRNFSRSCSYLGKDLLIAAGAIALPMAIASKSFANFDDQMRLVRAVTKATKADFEALTETAEKLGRETSFTAKQVAEGMTGLGRMGFNSDEIQKAISHVLNLSRATGTELAEASNIAANAMRIFGIEASKMNKVADVLTATANGSAQTLSDLFEGLKMAGPQAKAAGESINDTAAALGVLANLGIKGSLAGTALRKSYSRMVKTDVQKKLKSLGIETTRANGDLRKMSSILIDLARVMNEMPSAEKLAFAQDVFDIRGSLAGLSLTGNSKQLEAFIAKLHDIDGTAANTATEMDAGLGGAFRRLWSAVEGAMNAIGKALETTLQPFVEKVTVVVRNVINWINANQELVTALGITVASAAALGGSLLAIGTLTKGVAAGIGIVKTALQALTFTQGLAVAESSTLGNSFKLLAQSFTNYRNAAIPAMVGTSQLLAALNLPIDVRSKQIAAGLILMSKAETAVAAKTILAAKYQAISAALKKFSTASLMAAAASKAHATGATLSAIATATVAKVKMAAAAATTLFSAANIKAAATSTAGAIANTALAVSAKAIAAGYLAANSAAAVFAAIPVSWVVIGIGAALVGLVYWLSQAGKYTANLTDKVEKLRQKNDEGRKIDELRMERLKQLSEKQKLSNAELTEAENLSGKLQQKYGDLGISIDKLAGKLTLAADAQSKFNEAMKKAAIADLEAEISELQSNLKELGLENESLLSHWNHNLMSQITGRQEEAIKQLEINGDKAVAVMKKLQAAKLRIKAIKSGDKNAVTGTAENTEQNIQTEKQRRSVSHQSTMDAASRLEQIDRQLVRERRTELENEIFDIQELNKEYKKLIQTILDFEKSKADNLQDKKKIAELEKKLSEADKLAVDRIAQAENKAAEKLNNDVAQLEKRFADTEKDFKQRRAEKASNRTIDDALKKDKDSGIAMLQKLISEAKAAAEQAKKQYQKELESAKADGVIDNSERQKLDDIQTNYSKAETMLDKYEAKLREAQNSTAQAAENFKPQGAFLASALEALGGSGTAADRTAKATEKIVANTKKTNDYLRKGNTQVSFT